MKRWFWLGLALVVGTLGVSGVRAGMISPRLQEVLSTAAAGQQIPVHIALRQQADNAALERACARMTKEERWAYVVSALKRFSEVTQRDLLSSLASKEASGQVSGVKGLWIVNSVGCEATPSAIQSLAARPDVWYVDYDRVGVTLNAGKGDPSGPPSVYQTEPNVRLVGADSVWNLLGVTGQNVIVGVIDTGIRYTHQDLVNHLWNSSVYPNHGFNFASNQFTRGGNPGPSPYDSLTPLDYYGHGTHVAGIVSADGAYGNGTRDTMGIAPRARMMSVPVDVYLHTPFPDTAMENETMEGMQFCVSPTRDPSNHAHVLTMSLGLIASWLPQRALWRQAVTNVATSGLPFCIEAGSEGPTARTIRTPGDVPGPWHHPSDGTGGQGGAITVGCTDNSDNLASFSSIGPADWGTVPPYNDYVYPPGLMKPDVCAPGVNIFSTYNTSDQAYTTMSGTAMATACAPGVVALMLSKNPALLPWQVDSILQMTVRPLGAQPKNNTFGTGRVSAYQAVLHTPLPYPQFRLTVAGADTMPPSSTKVDSVTVTSMDNFSSPVTMTLDSIRPNTGTITVAFNPNPVTPPPNGSVKTGMLMTTSATPDGNYGIFYHGTGDTVTRWGQMDLWVTSPTFILTSTPRSRSVVWGDFTTYADTLISVSGFNSPCTLSTVVSPPSPSITVSFLPNNIVIPTDGRTMQVRAGGGTPPRTYLVTITARCGNIVRTLDDTLVVRYPMVQGPDPYGYYAYDNTDIIFGNAPVYNWIELNPSRGGNGVSIGPGGDDVTFQHALTGIHVRHYGLHFDYVSICSNGWLAIGSTTSSVYTNYALPSNSFVPNGVAIFWDDLDLTTSGTWWYRRDANQRFIAQWDSVPRMGTTSYNTFEIIVWDTSLTSLRAPTRDSDIILQWKRAPDISSMSVGQQNSAMNVGLNCLYNGIYDPMMAPIVPGRALKYTTEPPRDQGVESSSSLNLPVSSALGPALPNPATGFVNISYALSRETPISLKVYNLSGQLVRTLASGKEQAGYKHATWDGRGEDGSRVASGVYFYRLEAGSFAATKKMVVVR